MELINIEELNKLSPAKQIEAKKDIINNLDLPLIPTVYLPPVITEGYYFISYSHKDYRKVYSDLFDLESMGLSIWYDRGIPAGSNWKDTALKYLAPFECKGVLFYISENALLSDSIKEEIKFTLDSDKPFSVIFIGEEKTLSDLIERLFKEKKLGKEDYDYFNQVFPKEVLYLRLEEAKESKYEKIVNRLPKQILLNLNLEDDTVNEDTSCFHSLKLDPYGEDGDEGIIDEVTLQVIDINDYYARKITFSDYLDAVTLLTKDNNLNRNVQDYILHLMDGDLLYARAFDKSRDTCRIECDIKDSALSRLRNLEYVEIPTLAAIHRNAFLGCKRLKEVKFIPSSGRGVYLDNYAFKDCFLLEVFDFSDVTHIGISTFENCKSLNNVHINDQIKEIPENAFYWCKGLKTITFGKGLKEIKDYAFEEAGIEELVLPENLESIGERAFYGNDYLKKIVFNKKLKTIGDQAFELAGCDSNKCYMDIDLPASLEKIGARAFTKACIGTIHYDGKLDDFVRLLQNPFTLANENATQKDGTITLICRDKTVYLKDLW